MYFVIKYSAHILLICLQRVFFFGPLKCPADHRGVRSHRRFGPTNKATAGLPWPRDPPRLRTPIHEPAVLLPERAQRRPGSSEPVGVRSRAFFPPPPLHGSGRVAFCGGQHQPPDPGFAPRGGKLKTGEVCGWWHGVGGASRGGGGLQRTPPLPPLP